MYWSGIQSSKKLHAGRSQHRIINRILGHRLQNHYIYVLSSDKSHWNKKVNVNSKSSSSGSLSTRQVQMFDVAIPLVVELVLSAFYILSSSSSPASFVMVWVHRVV